VNLYGQDGTSYQLKTQAEVESAGFGLSFRIPATDGSDLTLKSISVEMTSPTEARWTLHIISPEPLTEHALNFWCRDLSQPHDTFTVEGGTVAFTRTSGTETDGTYEVRHDFLVDIENSPSIPIRGSHCWTWDVELNTANAHQLYGENGAYTYDRFPVPSTEFDIPVNG
jgi:hypothetical protein